jgi:hypothetical protein
MLRSTLALAAVFALVLTFAPPSIATSPQTKCKITKLNAATTKLAGKLKCYTNAMKKSVPIDATCLAKAEQKFADAFAKVEARTKGGCAVTGEAPGVETQVDQLFTKLLDDEPDSAVCLSSGSFCLGSPAACCPGLTCQLTDTFLFIFSCI